MPRCLSLVVDDAGAGARLDLWLARLMPDQSRARIQTLMLSSELDLGILQYFSVAIRRGLGNCQFSARASKTASFHKSVATFAELDCGEFDA